jgi:acetolactate synthase-1/3 small subunit
VASLLPSVELSPPRKRRPRASDGAVALDARIRGHDKQNNPHKKRTSAMTQIERHTIAVVVDNEAGILARVVGLFSGRGYNIDSLTVAEVDAAQHLSRITVVTSGTPMIIEQIKNQLNRLVPVHKVSDLTTEGPHLERELALIKVRGTGDKRVESLRIADVFRARVVDSTIESFVFELTGSTEKLNAFINLMQPLGLVDVSRTGVVAIARGPEAL